MAGGGCGRWQVGVAVKGKWQHWVRMEGLCDAGAGSKARGPARIRVQLLCPLERELSEAENPTHPLRPWPRGRCGFWGPDPNKPLGS